MLKQGSSYKPLKNSKKASRGSLFAFMLIWKVTKRANHLSRGYVRILWGKTMWGIADQAMVRSRGFGSGDRDAVRSILVPRLTFAFQHHQHHHRLIGRIPRRYYARQVSSGMYEYRR